MSVIAFPLSHAVECREKKMDMFNIKELSNKKLQKFFVATHPAICRSVLWQPISLQPFEASHISAAAGVHPKALPASQGFWHRALLLLHLALLEALSCC